MLDVLLVDYARAREQLKVANREWATYRDRMARDGLSAAMRRINHTRSELRSEMRRAHARLYAEGKTTVIPR